jgi:hypothetical protein
MKKIFKSQFITMFKIYSRLIFKIIFKEKILFKKNNLIQNNKFINFKQKIILLKEF